MGRDEDLAPFVSEDVSWLTVDRGERVSGPAAVRDYILRLHARMTGRQQRALEVTDGHAYLEGYDVNGPGGLVRDVSPAEAGDLTPWRRRIRKRVRCPARAVTSQPEWRSAHVRGPPARKPNGAEPTAVERI